jgi:tryptophanyl-tRNA synthetase
MANKKGKIAKQKTLPTMTDRKIEALEDAALAYAEVRDERIELSKSEIDKKSDLMALMHQHKKKSYHRGNIHIDLIVEKEKIKVKIKSQSDDSDDSEDELEDEDVEVGIGTGA